MRRRTAFTLIEVLISVALLSLVLLGLYESLDLQRNANRQLHTFLQKSLNEDRVAMVLYKDLLFSDGNLTLVKGEYDRICIEQTTHSLYGIPGPRVCWIVRKEGRELLRVEGGRYRLPLKREERVAVDRVMRDMEFFEVRRNKGDVFVAFQAKGERPYAFLLQGIDPPPKRLRRKKKPPGVTAESNNTVTEQTLQ